jgi:hypothetical protein
MAKYLPYTKKCANKAVVSLVNVHLVDPTLTMHIEQNESFFVRKLRPQNRPEMGDNMRIRSAEKTTTFITAHVGPLVKNGPCYALDNFKIHIVREVQLQNPGHLSSKW